MTEQNITAAQHARNSKAYGLQELRNACPVGGTVYTLTTHTSRSGMLRVIRPIVFRAQAADQHDGETASKRDLSYLMALAGIAKEHPKHYGVKVGGCGMDMGFSLVYGLSGTLYPDGFDCIGKSCPSNDHSNDRWVPGDSGNAALRAERYAPTRHHADGGYALRQQWL